MFRSPPFFRALIGLLSCSAALLADPAFTILSDGATPRVAYAVDHDGSTLTVRVEVAEIAPGAPPPRIGLGISARQTAVLDQSRAKVEKRGATWLHTFTLPEVRFDSPEDARFRRALSVEWVDARGRSVQRQNFFTPPTWAPHRGIGRDASAWGVFSLTEHQAAQARLAKRIAFTLHQPIDGKASVVIENRDGRRVRNLVSGQAYAAGEHELVWDGLDDDGMLVSPGDYRWRAISHPGITPRFLNYFYAPEGGTPWAGHLWLADHSNPTSAAAHGDRVVLGAPVSESGNNIVMVDLDGNRIMSASLSSFIGLGRLYLALGPDRVYALSEGSPHYESVRRDEGGNQYVYGNISLVAWDHSGAQQRYRGRHGEHPVLEYRRPVDEGRGHDPARRRLSMSNLRGAVWLDGSLYLSLHDENRILRLDPADGAERGSIPLDSPGAIATDGKSLFVLGATHVFRVDSPAGPSPRASRLFSYAPSERRPHARTPFVSPALAVGPGGELFIADNGVDQNVKVYAPDGRQLRQLGERGGAAARGPWQARAMREPTGLAVDSRGRLWIAENEETPKRVAIWNPRDDSVLKEIFGPPPYSGTGAGFDPRDVTRWIAGGALWQFDPWKGGAKIVSTLHRKTRPGELPEMVDGHNVRVVHHGDRTFLFAKGRYIEVFELMPDGSARIRAALGSLSGFQAKPPRWSVPAVFTEHPALKEELAEFVTPAGRFQDQLNHGGVRGSRNANSYTVLWIDRDGDEIPQVDEIQVSGPDGPRLVIPYWSAISPGLDLGFAVNEGRAWSRATLKLRGFLPSGAPDWDLAEAYRQAVPLRGLTPGNVQASMLAANGKLLLNASPMVGVDERGEVVWRMRNDWIGVHGSHRAPLPEIGVMQGNMGFLGEAPLDDVGSITVLNGNHGRFFALTTDGIYLDEFFDDVRVALERSPYRIGGEAFGGSFARDAKSGRYLLHAGHGAIRVYELEGMNRLVRSAGGFGVTAAQLTAAQELNEARAARQASRAEAVLRAGSAPAGSQPAEWPGAWTAEWGDATRPFPHARVKALRDGADLVLGYEVKDPTPWLNHGVAQNLLFKTGDAIDFQFSTDPAASPTRSSPVPGDRRLLVADYQGSPVAVLYDYVVPGTTEPVFFNSPWRSARVDRVVVLDDAVIKVRRTRGAYTVVVRVPLATLGLPADAGHALRADFGVIYGDEDGETNILRSYWANPSTGLVNDVPGETMINPSLWGGLKTE